MICRSLKEVKSSPTFAARTISSTYQTPLQLHIDIIAALCCLTDGSAQDVIIAVLSAGLEKENNDALINIGKFGNIEALV